MENEGDRPARGKSRKSKERAGNSSSAKRPPPILLSEEGDSAATGLGAKGPASGAVEKPPARGNRTKATRRAEREPTSPEQEEDIIDGFAIVSFGAEESLKNALKKHCNVYENRIMQLPSTRVQSSSSCRGGGAADATASSSRSCASGVTTSAAAAAVDVEGGVDGIVEESPKRAAVSKGSLGHTGKGKENKSGTTPAGSTSTLGGDTSSSPASASKNSSVKPTSTPSPSSDSERRTEATLTTGKPSDFSSKTVNSAVSKSLDAELSLLASVPPKGSIAPAVSEQGLPPLSSSVGPPELCAVVNLPSSTGDLPPASPTVSEGACSVSLCASAPSPLHPQVTVGIEAAVPPQPSPAAAVSVSAAAAAGGSSSSSSNRESLSSSSSKRSKSSEPPSSWSASAAAQPAAASATASHGGSGRSSAGVRGSSSSSLWPRGGEGKAHTTSSTQLASAGTGRSSSAGSSGGSAAAAPGMAAWHAVVDGTGAASSSSMAASAQPLIAAYGNHVATMLGMASPQSMPGAGQPFFSTPNIMTLAAAAGLPVLPPSAAYSPEFAAQELQREINCRLLGSSMERASLLSLPPAYLPSGGGGGGATTANGIPHAQLYEQMLHSAAAAGLPQHQAAAQHQHAVAAAAVAAAAAAACIPLPSLAAAPYGVSLVSAPSPHVFSGKAPKLDAATLALWGQPVGQVSGAFPLTAATAAALHASASGTGPSPFQSIAPTAGPVFGDNAAGFATKKSGKWCSAHVRIAYQIYQSQRKSKLEQSGSAAAAATATSSMAGFPGMRNDTSMGSHLSMLTGPPASAAGSGSGSSSRSSVLSAAAHESLHRAASGNGVPPPLLSSASGTPPSNAARSPHNANLSYSPAAAVAAMGSGFPTLPSNRDVAEWTARLGGAAALLSLAPAVMGWQHHLRQGREEPGYKDGATAATVVDRPSLPHGFGRELVSADGFVDSRAAESHSRRSGSKERSRGAASGGASSHRPRSRSPLRARSRESSAATERVKVKAERRDLDETARPSLDRQVAARGGGSTAAATMDMLLQQQQQQLLLLSAQPPHAGFGLPVDTLNGSRWTSGLSIPSGHAAAATSAAATTALTVPASSASALSVGDRRLWSPFERHSSAEAMPGPDADQRDCRPHLNYRLAAMAAAAERVMPPSAAARGSSNGRASSGSSRVKVSSNTPHPSNVSSPSGSTAAAASAGSAVNSSSITLNGHRSAAVAVPAQSVGSSSVSSNSAGRDRPLSPAIAVGRTSGSNPELPAPPCMLLPVRKTSSPGHPCATAATVVAAQVNGGASSDGSVPGSECETHSR